jgi:hypothetical protein
VGEVGKFLTINGGSNVGATVTDINTDLFHNPQGRMERWNIDKFIIGCHSRENGNPGEF